MASGVKILLLGLKKTADNRRPNHRVRVSRLRLTKLGGHHHRHTSRTRHPSVVSYFYAIIIIRIVPSTIVVDTLIHVWERADI